MQTSLFDRIQQLTTPYTAPHNEHGCTSALHAWLDEAHLPFQVDAYGNTLVHMRHGEPKGSVGFAAHLDHPALRVTAVDGSQVHCNAEGGLPPIGTEGAAIIFPSASAPANNPAQGASRGTIAQAQRESRGGRNRLTAATVSLNEGDAPPKVGDFGVFDLPNVERDGHTLKLRVADDLMGVVAIVAALEKLQAAAQAARENDKPVHMDVWGIFTRAEEIGFHGAIGLLMEETIPKGTVLVSVECSQAIAPVALGEGPVVRVGDRSGPFSPLGCGLLSEAAKKLHSNQGIPSQTALMRGGSCEGTAFVAFGYPAAGLALPLRNYHNQGPSGVAPEEVDSRDLQGATELIVTAAELAGTGHNAILSIREDLVARSEDGRAALRLSTYETPTTQA